MVIPRIAREEGVVVVERRDEPASRDRFNEWARQQFEAVPTITAEVLAEQAFAHFADDKELVEEWVMIALRSEAARYLLGQQYRGEHPVEERRGALPEKDFPS